MTTTFISMEEYLHAAYESDAEYVDGVIEERSVGESRHSAWQGTLTYFFMVHRHDWDVRVRPSLKTRISGCRYRIPDVAILDAVLAPKPIATTPPLIAFKF